MKIYMKLTELFDRSEKEYLPKISVNMDDVDSDDRYEIAGMLRGLMCSIEGWGSIRGFTNALFDDDGSVILTFSTIEKAHRFQDCVQYYFDETILEALKVKRRVLRTG